MVTHQNKELMEKEGIMDKVKEFLKWLFIEKKYISLVIFLYVIIGLSSYSIAAYQLNKEYKQKQAACEHDWRELYEDRIIECFDIYCPKCQKQDRVSYATWNRIQIDMEYRDKK